MGRGRFGLVGESRTVGNVIEYDTKIVVDGREVSRDTGRAGLGPKGDV